MFTYHCVLDGWINIYIYLRNLTKMQLVNMAVKSEVKCGIARRKSSQLVKFCVKEERNASYKKVCVTYRNLAIMSLI